MLLKKIYIKNFRQFVDETVIFATDKEKNVTVIMGGNGSGKTTFSRAIRWCLYGENDFSDSILFNKKIAATMMNGDTGSVFVSLILEHQGIEYTIKTEQSYKKESSNKLVPNSIRRTITKKVDGQTIDIRELQNEAVINSILPRELSRYFFFDGERMDRMRKEIMAGRSKSFNEAVNGLLGLNAIINAIEHLKPTSKYGVIGSYNESYDSRSDSKIAEYSRNIVALQQQIDAKNELIASLDKNIIAAEGRIASLNRKIGETRDGEALQKRKMDLEKEISDLKTTVKRTVESILSIFNSHYQGFFSTPLIEDALEVLSKDDLIDKGVPNVNDRTISFLINRRKCICGAEIIPGNDAYLSLSDLYKYVPPKALGTQIADFAKECEQRYKSDSPLRDNLLSLFAIISRNNEEIAEKQQDIKALEEKLLGFSDTSSLQREMAQLEQSVKQDRAKRDEYVKDIGFLETSRDRQETERSNLTLQDEKNRRIETYKAYAQYIYNELTALYSEKETIVRNELQNTINDIFNSIFAGTLRLTLDEKYNVMVSDTELDEFNENIETSEAQSISVIFAFIAGIIKLARENQSREDAFLSTEPYPLVMDAPLSTFDKKRIEAVCKTLPSIAEQVIIFIKDTDGELAEQYMTDVIGCRSEFIKVSTVKTEIR